MTTLADLTRRMHERFARHPAVFDGEGWLTFGELDAAARRLANRLLSHGLSPGDRVVIALHNRPEIVVLDHALFRAGFVRVAVSARLHGYEVARIAHDCEAAAIVVEEGHVDPLLKIRAELLELRLLVTPSGDDLSLSQLVGPGGSEAIPDAPDPEPDDVAAIMYTSGTTGLPKGAIVTHRGWVTMARGFWTALPPSGPGDVVLHTAPMSHFGGSAGSAAMFRGAAVVPVRNFDPARVLRAVRDFAVTILPLVPTMLKELTTAAEKASEPVDFSSITAVPYGAAAISAQALARARSIFGDVLYQCYGLSEALAPLTVLSARDHVLEPGTPLPTRLSSAGRPLPEVELSVVGKSGIPLPAGQTGEVRVRGEAVMPGYWQRAEESAEVLEPDGWFRTGDVGYLDTDCYLYLVDRDRDVVISGGFTIYPAEIERVIAEHPDVYEVVVVGVPHDRWGEAVAAVVVPREGAQLQEQDVIDTCRAGLASFKKPVQVEFTTELPVSNTGKLSRREIRDRYWLDQDRQVGE